MNMNIYLLTFIVFMVTGILNAGESPPPPVNAEKPPLVKVNIVAIYPTNNKILKGAPSDTTTVNATVTPP